MNLPPFLSFVHMKEKSVFLRMQKISYIKFENIEKLDTMGENFWWFRWKINLPYFSIVSTCLLDRNHCTQSGNRAIAQHVRSNFLVPLSYPLDTRQSETFLGGSNWNSSRARIDLCPILAVLCRRACLLPSLPPCISNLLQPGHLPLDLEHFGTNVPIFLPQK